MNKCNPDIYFCNQSNFENVKLHADLLIKFLKETAFLTEAYILDFFVEDLWSKFPSQWTEVLSNFEIEDLEEFLNSEKSIRYKQVWPLSLLAFRASAFALTVSRKSIKSPRRIEKFVLENYRVENRNPCINSNESNEWKLSSSEFENKSGQHKSIPDFCRKHVKPKKQHEIFRMAQTTDVVLKNLDVKHIVDVGSGQGHLSRFLALCYNFKVATIEANWFHVSGAEKFDKQAFSSLQRSQTSDKTASLVDESLPYHLNHSVSLSSLEKVLKEAGTHMSENRLDNFGFLGLHTCGNLCETILKTFVKCDQSQVVLSVGCCYMKIDSVDDCEGFPLSNYVKTLPSHHLSYEAKELACHALEIFTQRLIENAPTLKIHCYRATLEKCILQSYPNKKHLGLRGVKHAELLSFDVYAEKALSRVGLSLPREVYASVETQKCLHEWKKVLIFYSIRLMTAPVVESFILIDRLIYLFEQGSPGCIAPIFDPYLSPRNQIIISCKS